MGKKSAAISIQYFASVPPSFRFLTLIRTLIRPSLCRWVTQNAFKMAVGGAPEWDAVRPALAASQEDFVADFAGFRVASKELLARIFRTLDELDLIDVRKSV